MDNNNELPKYDRNLLIDNINLKLEERGLKPADIVGAGIAAQPTVSKCLSKTCKKPGNFTVPQLIELSGFLKVSLDELLGIKSYKDDSIADILDLFCEIFEVAPFRIEKVKVPTDRYWREIPSQFDSDKECLIDQERYALYFDSHRYDDAFAAMAAILSQRHHWGIMFELLAAWRKNLENTYGKYPANDALYDGDILPFS